MGRGIAQVCALSGFEVLLYDVQPEGVSAAVNAIEKNLNSLVEKDKISSVEKKAAIDLIKGIADANHLIADLIIEAAVENINVKQKIFAGLEFINDEGSIFTSNTSSISITQIAASLKHPDRFAGLHFFNPAPVMKLVEIVKGAATSENTIKLLHAFSQKISKQAVSVQDSPGFIVNRVARHFYVESLKILEENVADVKTVDVLMRSAGFKMGPFELMDLIGIDVNFSVTHSIYNAFHQDPKFRPARIQQQKIEAGHLGRKTGKGFYDY
jgi:3-hydroxybutyryl-CoA dehydrogenase